MDKEGVRYQTFELLRERRNQVVRQPPPNTCPGLSSPLNEVIAYFHYRCVKYAACSVEQLLAGSIDAG